MTEVTGHDPDISGGVRDEMSPEAPSTGTWWLIYGTYLLVLMALFVGGAELVVRAKGYRPWQALNDSVSGIEVEPGGKFFQPDPVLGYTHIPGRFTVTLPLPAGREVGPGGSHTLRFNVTHLPNTLRITHPLETYAQPERSDQMWIFGCSFTHGWSVNDNETYPWLLQERFPEFEVVNFGVSGYGEVHSLLQFREALKTKTPKIAVLAYAEFHDVRNTFSRERRKLVAPYNRLGPVVQPYARLNADGTLRYAVADVEYREFPLMRYSALSHFLEIKYDGLEPRWLRNGEVTRALILEMAKLAKEHGVTFVVATISGAPMTDFFRDNGILNVTIGVDPRLPENSNLPFDSHPSAHAQAQYADRLEKFLKSDLARTN